jgi:hypothetical protein
MSYSSLVASWRGGSTGFFKFLDDVKPVVRAAEGGFIPFAPGPRERLEITRALDEGDHSTVVFCWPRRHGKTVSSVMILLWRFVTRPTENIAVVANSQRQIVDTGFRTLTEALEHTPFLKRLVDGGTIIVGADSIRLPATASAIQAFSANPSALWGKKLTAAQISELHAAATDGVLDALRGSLIDSAGSLLLIDSTVGPLSSPLFGLYQAAQRGDDPALFFSHIQYDDLDHACRECPPWIDEARLRSLARTMIPRTFGAYHLNRWQDGASLLLSAETLERCIDGEYLANGAAPELIAAGARFVVGAGLDRAYGGSSHGDATITTAVLKMVGDDDDEHYYVLASDAVPFSRLSGIKGNLTRYHRQLGMTRLGLESYGAQDVRDWSMGEPFADGTELIHPSRKTQFHAFTALHTIAAEGRLHIDPSMKRLVAELKTFEVVDDGREGVGNEALPKFGHARGCHDDAVYSLAWAVHSLRDVTLNPYELYGVACNGAPVVRPACALNGGSEVPLCASSCRSMGQARKMFGSYRERHPHSTLELAAFARQKVKNVGSHVFPR